MMEKTSGVGGKIAKSGEGPYRVMVVDDSAVVRGLLTRALESDPEIEVVSSVANGKIAVDTLSRRDIEIVVLDIEMPVMDGLTALPLILEKDPEVMVIMASTLTLRNANISLRALALGAADYIPKPSATRELSSGFDFKTELIRKVKALGVSCRGSRGRVSPRRERAEAKPRPAPAAAPSLYGEARVELRGFPGAFSPRILAIGSSTGGPQALFKLLGNIGKDFKLPILITQHMPATFTKILAEHIDRMCDRPCSEVTDGEPVLANNIYVAPGEYHLTVEDDGGRKVFRLTQDPPENYCRPSVDPMFRSVAREYGNRVLGLILTGMGQDGTKGSKAIIDAGGAIIAQDEATSIVWGMPGSVATNGICSAILPIGEIGDYICKLVLRSAA